MNLEIAVEHILFVAEVDLEGEFLHQEVEEEEGFRLFDIEGAGEDVLEVAFGIFKGEEAHQERVGGHPVELEGEEGAPTAIKHSRLADRAVVVDISALLGGIDAKPEGLTALLPFFFGDGGGFGGMDLRGGADAIADGGTDGGGAVLLFGLP